MTTYINSVSGVIQIFTDTSQVPKCYYGNAGTSGKFYPIPNDRYLIQIGGDSYELYWQNIQVQYIFPITFLDAGRLLGQIFTIGTTTQPTSPSPTTIKVNPSNFEISEDQDFTVEWFMNMSGSAYYPRVYSIGAYPAADNAVSIEGGAILWWANSEYRINYTLPDFLYGWHHVAIVRHSGIVTIYFDGIALTSLTYSNAIPASTDLYIGSENTEYTYLDGKMSNFRWIKGVAVYTENFNPPTSPLEATNDTILLLLQGEDLASELTDNSGIGNTITNIGTTYSTDNPFRGYTGSTLFGNF